MNSALFYSFLYALSIFVCACTQIALKKSATEEHRGVRIYLNKTVLLSNIIFVASTLVTVVLYRYIEYVTITLLGSLSYIFVLVLSAALLKEKISKRKMMGSALIIAGIVVYALFGGSA